MTPPAPRPPLLELEGVEVRYRDVAAVRGVDLAIEGPEILALLGPSGCGKTSLLRAVAGFERPTAGRIRLAGETVASPRTWLPPERRKVGMVFQEGALFPHLTVRENVLYGLAGSPRADDAADRALALVGLDALGGRYPDELSGGQQQRVALARALAPSPRLVLLDEPFANLDAGLRERLRTEVREILTVAGATAVLVTHDQEEALSFADRVAVMQRGRILQIGSPEEVYHRPASRDVADFFGGSQLFDCTVRDGRAESVFGSVACDGPEGEGRLVVRPEDVVLEGRGSAGAGAAGGAPGRVLSTTFYGHDLLREVELAGGELLNVRCLTGDPRPVGDEVRVRLKAKVYRVFSD